VCRKNARQGVAYVIDSDCVKLFTEKTGTNPVTHGEKLRIARQSNYNAETIAKTTFVDDAELIWRELTGMTQQEPADSLPGWGRGRGRVSQFARTCGTVFFDGLQRYTGVFDYCDVSTLPNTTDLVNYDILTAQKPLF
jgi:hypothetical protein